MSDRPGKSRPMPAAPYDDESIPVLTERLTLPALDLDITLPVREIAAADAAGIDAPAVLPAAALQAAPAAPGLAVPPPAVLGAQFESDTWLVETIPMAPAPLDLSTLDLPSFDLPPLTPARPAPGTATEPPVPPVGTVASPSTESGFAQADLVIPASLMRVPAAAPSIATGSVPAAVETTAPTFDRLPRPPIVDALPALEPPAAAHAAFAITAPPAQRDETELRAAILDTLVQRLPQDVESVVRRQLAPAVDAAIDAAVAQLIPEIRRAVTHVLRDLIDHAVKAELAKLREPK
ncbi:MAG: hypothetical protein U5L03_08310 [Burkholderiaceae bacterium]|nr:hypothetical protein [Burkholderiaceae bacterium]